MINLKLVETTAHWRVVVIAIVARALGIVVTIDGIPFGSSRCVKPWAGETSSDQ